MGTASRSVSPRCTRLSSTPSNCSGVWLKARPRTRKTRTVGLLDTAIGLAMRDPPAAIVASWAEHTGYARQRRCALATTVIGAASRRQRSGERADCRPGECLDSRGSYTTVAENVKGSWLSEVRAPLALRVSMRRCDIYANTQFPRTHRTSSGLSTLWSTTLPYRKSTFHARSELAVRRLADQKGAAAVFANTLRSMQLGVAW